MKTIKIFKLLKSNLILNSIKLQHLQLCNKKLEKYQLVYDQTFITHMTLQLHKSQIDNVK